MKKAMAAVLFVVAVVAAGCVSSRPVPGIHATTSYGWWDWGWPIAGAWQPGYKARVCEPLPVGCYDKWIAPPYGPR